MIRLAKKIHGIQLWTLIKDHRERIAGTGVLTLMLCMVFAHSVSDYIYTNFTKSVQVVIDVPHFLDDGINNPRVIDNYYVEDTDGIPDIVTEKKYGFYNFEQLKKTVVLSNDIKIVEADQSEIGYGYFEFLSENAYIVLDLPRYPNTCLTISCDNNIYALSIKDDKGIFEREIGEPENTQYEHNSVRIYPFSESGSGHIYVYYIVIYVLLYMALFVAVQILIEAVKYLLCKNRVLNKETNVWRGVFLFILLSYVIFTAAVYPQHREAFQNIEGSDAYYYMYPQVWDDNGNFSIQVAADYLYTFRGYFPIVFGLCTNFFSSLLGVDVMYFYFLFNGVLVAFTLGVAVPKLYKALTGREATNGMCLMMYLLFFLFWHNYFFYALTDISAAMFAMSGVSYSFAFLNERKKGDLFLGGFFLGWSICYRAAYTYVLYILAGWIVVELFWRKHKKEILWRDVANIGMLCLGIVVICWPQFILNCLRDHVGLFPYNSGWAYDMNSQQGIDATWHDFTSGLHQYQIAMAQNKDVQLAKIDQYYYMNKFYSFRDLLFLLLNNPIEFLMGYLKRLFWALSVTAEIAYPRVFSWTEWQDIIVRMLNYVLLGNVIYSFFQKRADAYMKNKIKILTACLAVSTICIQNLVHIEKRYFLIFHLFIYFLNTFILLDYCKDLISKKNKLSMRYVFAMMFWTCVCYTAFRTISDNFL